MKNDLLPQMRDTCFNSLLVARNALGRDLTDVEIALMVEAVVRYYAPIFQPPGGLVN